MPPHRNTELCNMVFGDQGWSGEMNKMLISGTTRCRQGEKVFHVETTAWEGEGAWYGKPSIERSNTTEPATAAASRDLFANYGSYFWSKQG